MDTGKDKTPTGSRFENFSSEAASYRKGIRTIIKLLRMKLWIRIIRLQSFCPAAQMASLHCTERREGRPKSSQSSSLHPNKNQMVSQSKAAKLWATRQEINMASYISIDIRHIAPTLGNHWDAGVNVMAKKGESSHKKMGKVGLLPCNCKPRRTIKTCSRKTETERGEGV